jgi:hypothetical protein
MDGNIIVRLNVNRQRIYEIGINSWASKLFSLFILTDICFIALSILALSGYWSDLYPDLYSNPYFIEVDRGYAEFFQYMKTFWCILLMGLIAIRQRSPLYLSWMLLFLYLLADDCIEIHENLGYYLSTRLGFVPAFGLRARDFGEVLVSASVGLFLLSCIGMAYRLGDSVFRKVSRSLLIMLLALAVCGILVDLLHMMAPRRLFHVFGILEDGGEMIVMSAITTFILVVSDQQSTKQK